MNTMKKPTHLLLSGFLISALVLLTACGGGKVIEPPEDKDTVKIANDMDNVSSYDDLVAIKDKIVSLRPFSEALFSKFLAVTYSQYTVNTIDMFEATSVYDGLFKGCANEVWTAVDSTMKTSVYKNLEDWSRLSKFIAKNTAEYKQIFDALESPNQQLEVTDDMIQQYYAVLQLSRSQFWLSAHSIKRFTGNYEPVEQMIKANKYWSTYFCHNVDITSGIREFPTRLRNARNKYYEDLKDLIIRKATEDSITSNQLNNAITRFQSFDCQQSQKDALSNFLMGYPTDDSRKTSYDPFWR